MEPNQSLQTTEFDHLLKLEKIEQHHLETLTPEKQKEFRKMLTDMLTATKGEERDVFLEKVAAIVENDKIWEYNHARITDAIERYIKKFAALPTKVSIAEATGLSRKTVKKHMQEFATAPVLMQQQHETYGLMKQQVLNRVLQCALEGDVSAAKLFLQAMNQQADNITNNMTIHNQNNYIQINGTVLNQQVIQQLKPGQLKQIERIIKKSQDPAKLSE